MEKAIVLELTKTQAENLAEFIELNLLEDIRRDGAVDNIRWVCDMCDVYKKLKGAGK